MSAPDELYLQEGGDGWPDNVTMVATVGAVVYVRKDMVEAEIETAKIHHAQAFGAGIDYADRLREALQAENARLREALVKPLPWRNSYGVERADTEFGTWYIKGKIVEFSNPNFSMVPTGDLKEAAQAKHEKMVLAALLPNTQGEE